jgi:ubiquinone biosynthesis protein
MSNRQDLLPEELIFEFQKLQSNVPPFPTKKAIEVIESETGKKIDEIFSYFEEKVIGSASIGQVHRARLVTGEEVVVKVQRPDVRKQIESDLQIIKDIVNLGDNYFKKQGVLNAMDIVESFEKVMQKELAYLTEARSMEQFRNFYKDNHTFYVPKPYKELSTEKVLIIEYVSGCKITDVDQMREWGLEPTEIAEQGMDIYLTQIFEFGYFHADPHPGNIIIQENGRIVLIDFGMVGKMMDQDKYAFAGIFIAMANMDAREMAIQMRNLAVEHEIKDMRRLEMELNDVIEDFAYLDVEESSIADISQRLQDIMYQHKMVVPAGVFLIFRALAILEGIGKTIHPHFNTMEKVKPFGRKLVMERFSARNIWRELTFRGQSFYSFLSSFPYEVRGILRKLRKGELRIEVVDPGRAKLLDKLDSVGNRLSMAMIISAMTMAASLIMIADPGYGNGEGIPNASIVLFVIAGIFGFFFLLAMWRSGKNDD